MKLKLFHNQCNNHNIESEQCLSLILGLFVYEGVISHSRTFQIFGFHCLQQDEATPPEEYTLCNSQSYEKTNQTSLLVAVQKMETCIVLGLPCHGSQRASYFDHSFCKYQNEFFYFFLILWSNTHILFLTASSRGKNIFEQFQHLDRPSLQHFLQPCSTPCLFPHTGQCWHLLLAMNPFQFILFTILS